jgi:RHS repeat-associated protein
MKSKEYNNNWSNTKKSLSVRSEAKAEGRRRNPVDWSYQGINPTHLVDRGFTGHEHLDWAGLINMNGRMYDPVIGRFLGVDPLVADGDNSQSFNSYSYTLNNPLKFTDPSGFVLRQLPEYNGYSVSSANLALRLIYARIAGADGDDCNSIISGVNWHENESPQGGGGVRFANETAAYNFMWNHAKAERREYAAYITSKGVIITPSSLNTARQGEFLKYYNPTWQDGALFITFENKNYQVIGGIHTHQAENSFYGYDFSGDDDWTTIKMRGIPFFSINYDNTANAQFSDGKYCYPMILNASRTDILNGFSLINYILNYGK